MSLPKLPPSSRCNYCGQPATGWDHLIPKAKGGTDDPSNLIPACGGCNAAKGRFLLPHQFRLRIGRQNIRKPWLTHVQVNPATRDKLTEQKRGNDTYDDVIRRALAALAEKERAPVGT